MATPTNGRPSEDRPLSVRVAAELRQIGAWAFGGAWLAEHLSALGSPAYDSDTGEPINPAAWVESLLSILLGEYLEPGRRHLERLQGVLRAQIGGAGAADDVAADDENADDEADAPPCASADQVERLHKALPRGGAWTLDEEHGIVRLELTLQSAASAAAFAAFVEAVCADDGIQIRTVATKTLVVVCVVAGASSEDALRRCLRMVSVPGLDPTESGS